MTDFLLYHENELAYLVDTGSPFSVNYGSSRLGNTIEKIYPGLLHDLSDKLKLSVTGIIGTDQLKQSRWHFDPTSSKLTRLSDDFDLSTYRAFPIEKYLGLPVVEVQLDDHIYRLIIDTCSTLNYLKESLLRGPIESTKEDYHPMLGSFTTHGRRYRLSAFNQKSRVLMYDLPTAMEMALGDEIQGILGCDFMTQHEWVMDLNKNTWWIR
jgi:hypothetical protein